MPLVQTRGAASAQGFGEFAQVTAANYIEDVFSIFLYTGNGGAQTINNGIDLAGKGGLVWIKSRTSGDAALGHVLTDTVRGRGSYLRSQSTNAAVTSPAGYDFSSFNVDGFSLNDPNGPNQFSLTNASNTYCSWTFRKQPKFFDVVTYTGTGSAQTISHNLGSTPGCIIIKSATDTERWTVYHRSLTGVGYYLDLSETSGESSLANGISSVTSTNFTVGSNSRISSSGQTFVAYLFAHDAGGFGLSGTDNVISCGSCSSDASGYIQPVNLGYEPQWVMLKRTNSAANWVMMDTMRGMAVTAAAASPILLANTSAAEAATGVQVNPTATGFQDTLWGGWGASNTYIYIAIRRGPMKVPTLGTSVFSPVTRAGTSAIASVTGVGFPPDSALIKNRADSGASVDWSFNFFDKLRSPGFRLSTAFTNAEDTAINFITSFNQNGITFPAVGYTATNGTSYNYINYFFRRAPSFFDEVCYTGTGSIRTVAHNLAAVPELMIVKGRSIAERWSVYSAPTTATKFLILDGTTAATTNNFFWNDTAPTSSVFTLGTQARVNNSGSTYVAYLFATCAGVSKVFSYTGNGSSQTINCGFTAGSRFVMIKRTDSTGDWYVWDSARGIVAGNDPHLSLNDTAAEVTTDDSVDTDNTGFIVNQVAATNVNVTSATYIGIAIA